MPSRVDRRKQAVVWTGPISITMILENAMNWDQIKGEWLQLKGKIRDKWGKLTDDDLEMIAGKKDQLLGKLQKEYGFNKERAEKELDEFLRTW
jgi:uncharacterized protein YjbJ (UPF0337 family)